MCRHDGVLADFAVMGHLDKVVELHTLMNNGLSHGRAVDTGIGTNLHIIFDNYNTQLRNLLVTFGVRCETKAVGTNHATGMDGYILANLTTIVDGDVGIDDRTIANLHAFTHKSERTDINILANLGRFRNEGQWMDARLLGKRSCIHLQQLGHTLIGVLHANERSADGLLQLNVLIDEHDTGFSLIDIRSIFRI